jgi:outer membrane protein W
MALGIPTGVGALGSDLGEAQAVPVVLTATYRLIENRRIWPYLGIGPSVLFTRNAKVTNPMLTEVNHPEMSIDPAPGLVLQGGLEARLTRSIYARVDVKFIAFMLARAEVRHINVKTPGLPLFDSVEVGTAKMNIWVNPFIVQAGLGADFDLW